MHYSRGFAAHGEHSFEPNFASPGGRGEARGGQKSVDPFIFSSAGPAALFNGEIIRLLLPLRIRSGEGVGEFSLAAWLAAVSDKCVADVEFERLVEEFYMPLYRFGLSLSRKESDAADLTQHTFYTWAKKGHQLRDRSKAKTWLFTTLYREFLARKRHNDRFVDVEADAQFVEPLHVAPSVVSALDGAIVQEALLALEDRYRAPVTLFYMKQHSYREIAAILEIPIGTVMSRISRGKAELRARLSDFAARDERKVVSMKEAQADG